MDISCQEKTHFRDHQGRVGYKVRWACFFETFFKKNNIKASQHYTRISPIKLLNPQRCFGSLEAVLFVFPSPSSL